jgi:hypothetical protein
MTVLTIVTCLMCSVNTSPRTELSVFFPTMADCLIIKRKWEKEMNVRVISACSNNAEESK